MHTVINIKNLATCFSSNTISECTRTALSFWPDDGSFELKHVAELFVFINIYRVIQEESALLWEMIV